MEGGAGVVKIENVRNSIVFPMNTQLNNQNYREFCPSFMVSDILDLYRRIGIHELHREPQS